MSYTHQYDGYGLTYFDNEVEIDITNCENCQYNTGECFKADKCLNANDGDDPDAL